jgi:hypothetical protein
LTKGAASSADVAVTDSTMAPIRTAKARGAGAGEDSNKSRSERV